ncbi:RNA polymerase sigma-70 factor [Sunxiuqinia elliptica]|uniref:RNA polymerase sigma factor n=1 Tax=Sunxiuqinia elliptica TaxID=655355 RepID=A0A1I2I7S3_9BACT|nr:RNA polymerase sigma-70 factor [Sunxiuqinia elliptica]SFF38509.1 RNA polymerase sigma-70 factor, ECF subfamily [Sunxiuqinia elliptica]
MDTAFNQDRILKELAKSNKQALEELFNYYYPRLYNFSKSFLKLEDGIDDVLQEVFLKIWHNRAEIKRSESFNSYIFTITRNLLLNELRSRLNNQKLRDRILEASVAEEFLSMGNVEYDELKEKVEEIINELPQKQREIFRMSRIEGLSHKEIAEKKSISTKTVEYHIGQSISMIKSRLETLGFLSVLYFYLFL